MAILDQIRSASSIASVPAPTLNTPTIYVDPTSPHAVMGDVSGNAPAEKTSLAYPLDIVGANHFMSFDIYDYSRESLNAIGTMKKLTKGVNNIRMPMSETLIDNQQIMYDSHAKVGTLTGGVINATAPKIQEWWNGPKGTPFPTGSAAAVGGAVAFSSFVNYLSSFGGGGGGGNPLAGVEAILGMAPNQFFTVLFVGPEYKRHRLTWNCSPKTFDEANELRLIIKTFKNKMAPRRVAGGLIWAFPKIFWIAIYNNSKFMYKFKPAVLETFTVNYAPGGRPAFYRSKTLTGDDSAPEGVTIQAQFLELEYWLDGNVTDSNNPFDVYHEEKYGDQIEQIGDKIEAFVRDYIINMEPGTMLEGLGGKLWSKDQWKDWWNTYKPEWKIP